MIVVLTTGQEWIIGEPRKEAENTARRPLPHTRWGMLVVRPGAVVEVEKVGGCAWNTFGGWIDRNCWLAGGEGTGEVVFKDDSQVSGVINWVGNGMGRQGMNEVTWWWVGEGKAWLLLCMSGLKPISHALKWDSEEKLLTGDRSALAKVGTSSLHQSVDRKEEEPNWRSVIRQ